MPDPAGDLRRAAARGDPLGDLLARAAGGLMRLAGADRAGVWLKPAWPARALPGVVLDPGDAGAAAEMRRLEDVLPWLQAAEAGRESEFLIAGKSPSLPFLGPLAGMRAAALLPLWFADRFLGLAVVAWAKPVASPEDELLERVVGELSLIVARQQAAEDAEHARRQASELARLSGIVAGETPAREALREVAFAARWLTGAAFVAVARPVRFPEIDIEACDPPDVATRSLLGEEPVRRGWQAALAERRAVETLLPARPGAAPLLILAHPLETPRGPAGLLLAGWPPGPGESRGASSIEPFLALAAAAWARAVGDPGCHPPAEQPQAEAVLAALLDSVDCGVLLFGDDGSLRAVNEGFARMLRAEPARVAELATFDRLVARLAPQFADPESVAARWREGFAGGEASWDELVLRHPEQRLIERFARPVFDRAGRRLAWMEVYRDVSDRRLIESRLFHADRMAMIGQLISGVAHELNNPLTSILGYAQLLFSRPGPVRSGDLEPILNEAERASRIAKNLLLFAREGEMERSAVDLNEVVERTLTLRCYELRREGIRVGLRLERRLPPALADASQIQQVLLNLIINAEQAIRQGRGRGEITVCTRCTSAGRVALQVADDGPGIAPEDLARIFDPFFTTKPPGVGTGLGLSIVYGIVHDHGGEVLVESEPGAGATFTVELPVAGPAMALAKSRGSGVPAPSRPVAVERRRGRILVVEDEPTVARLIADVLREMGHPVDTVLDSREGLQLASYRTYALVICDLRMPHLDGRTLYRKLRRHDPAVERRFVFVTGDMLAPHTREFLESSGVPFLAKPFRVEELKEIVDAAIAAANQAGAGQAEHGPRSAARKR